MKIMRIRSSSIKALGFFIIMITIGFGSVVWYVKTELEIRYEQNRKEINEKEWMLIRNSLALELKQAKSDGLNKVAEIKYLIYSQYNNDMQAIGKDLDSYNEPNNPIRTILTNSIEGMFFNGIDSENTDPFIIRGNVIETDNSNNCATFGSSREFIDEYKMHANPYLAQIAFNRIQNADVENMNTAAIDRPIFFQFISHSEEEKRTKGETLQERFARENNLEILEEHKGKNAQILSSYDIDGLKEYFFQTESWEKTFYAFEFVTPSYIFNRTDLAGRAFVIDGKRTSYPRLSINVVFNFKNVIDHNPILKRDLQNYEFNRRELQRQHIQDVRVLYLILVLLLLICTFGMKYTNKLATMEGNNADGDLYPRGG